MTPSSPSPPGALHQHADPDGNQDDGPESPEPIEVEPAKLLQQEDHAQGDQHKRSHRYARASAVLFLHRRSFHPYAGWHTCGRSWRGAAPEQVQVVQAERIGRTHAHHFRLGGLVGLDRHIQHEGRNAEAKQIVHVVRRPDQAGKDQYVNKSLRILAVVHGAHARNKAEKRCQPGAASANWWWDARSYGSRSRWWRRHGAAHLRGQTLLAVNDATHISRAGAAQWLATCAAVCNCGYFDMVGAVHIVLQFSRACGVCCSTAGQLASTGWPASRL